MAGKIFINYRRYHGSYKGAPTDGSAWTSGDCSRRVIRGGSWVSAPQLLRTAVRIPAPIGGRVVAVGFRVGRTLTP
jgi:formylglycine-generating enzyme required for sulfatase activity